ncbi:MAG: aldehyde dehydrogenase family protein [Phycisphaeraceae bacterium]
MALQARYPFYVGGERREGGDELVVTDKSTGEVATRVARADGTAVEEAIASGAAGAEAMRAMPTHARQAVLRHCVARVEQRRDELAEALCIEAGKPIRDARGEVARLADTFRIAEREAEHASGGEVLAMDLTERGERHVGMTRRVPVGVCSLITPFNFPLNLVAHKVAPAIAAGCPFILKPAPRTPLGAILIGEILAETDLPPAAWSVVTCNNEDASALVEDDRIALLSFTGSDRVGWQLKREAGRKRVLLELGGNAAVIVEPDADVADGVERIALGGFYQSGQSCISVQRVYVHEAVYDAFRDRLVAHVRDAWPMGAPMDEATRIGPMIDEAAAERVEQWIGEAQAAGGRVLCGGGRDGVMHEATIIENVPADARLMTEEAFGPVVVLARYSDFDDALRRVNASRFGLQAGVFTRDLAKAHRAWDRLDVGAVLINEIPSWRVDHMPYGGVKDSGLGREGPRYAIEHMTELRLMVVRQP